MKKLNFGVMGCASVAKRLVIPAMKVVPTIDLIAVASRTIENAQKFAEEFDCKAISSYEELLDIKEIQAIYMPLPTGLHFEWANRALDAGKHLFIEKSLASNFSEANAIIEKARSKKLLVKENYMFEYHSQQMAVSEIIKSRAGKIRLFRASFGFPPLDESNFRYKENLGGGALLDAGGYVLKAMGVFFPDFQPKICSANLTMGKSGVDIAGTVAAELWRDDYCIPAQLAFGFDHHYQCNIEVWGSDSKISTNRTFTAGNSFSPEVYIESPLGNDTNKLSSDNHFRNILTDFSNKILTEDDFEIEYKKILNQAILQEKVRKISTKCS